MVSLDNSSIAVSFATFDDFGLLGIYLKHKLFAISIVHGSHSNVFQRNDSFRNVLRRVLEVVQATIVKDEPATLPSLPASALQHKILMSDKQRHYCSKIGMLRSVLKLGTRVLKLKRKLNIDNVMSSHNKLSFSRKSSTFEI